MLWFIFHVFIYFWARVVALTSRQHCRLLIAPAGELTVIAGVSEPRVVLPPPPFRSPRLLQDAVSSIFHPCDMSLEAERWHCSSCCREDHLAAEMMGPSFLSRVEQASSKTLSHIWEEVGALQPCLCPGMVQTPVPGRRDEREENTPWEFSAQVEETWNAKWILRNRCRRRIQLLINLFCKCNVPCQPHVFRSPKLRRVAVNDVLRVFRSCALPYTCSSPLSYLCGVRRAHYFNPKRNRPARFSISKRDEKKIR